MVVIARYEENVDWLNRINKEFIIFNKGEKINVLYGDTYSPHKFPLLNVENEGREGDTWLRYILYNYHDLPENIYFVQGNPFPHFGGIVEFINANVYCPSFIPLGGVIWDDGFGHPHHPTQLFISSTCNRIFGSDKSEYRFSAGAQYMINRACILNKPIEWWMRLYEIYKETPDNAWVFERLWPEIWTYKKDK